MERLRIVKVLAGDIGSTKTSLAVYEVQGTRLEPLMRQMPVKIILNPKTALYGPALHAGWRLGG